MTVRNSTGRGRNSEFLLTFAKAIDGNPSIAALSADTDGNQCNAGAFADGQSVCAMRAMGIDPEDALSANDSWGAFDAAGVLFKPGPTGTNVNDLRAILFRQSQIPIIRNFHLQLG